MYVGPYLSVGLSDDVGKVSDEMTAKTERRNWEEEGRLEQIVSDVTILHSIEPTRPSTRPADDGCCVSLHCLCV